jgi:FMN-dependent NADH-azoreductase
MTTLLHIDSSIQGDNSVSRQVTAAFADQWRQANPDGTYLHRDIAAEQVPHIDAASHSAGVTPEADHTDEQRAGWAISKPLVDELASADVVLIGVPMHNFTIPSTLKAWLDRIIVAQNHPNPETGKGALSDKQFVVVNARGGAYGPGTPRADFEFQERYLRAVLSFLGVKENLTFINAEMTLANVVPALAEFKDFAAESLENAHNSVRELATAGR